VGSTRFVWHPAVRVTLNSQCYRTAPNKDSTTSMRIMKSTDVTSCATLATAVVLPTSLVVLPTLLVVTRQGTTNDGGGGTT